MVIARKTGTVIKHVAASERAAGLIMLGCAVLGLVLANLPATSHGFEVLEQWVLGIPGTNIQLSVGHWAQDGSLTVFFLAVGLDLKLELTGGSLANPKAAAVPMLCAVGGMMVPPVLFVSVLSIFAFAPGTQEGMVHLVSGVDVPLSEAISGWAVPTATDIAFSLAVLALFAKALPISIRAFLMTLATVDDLLAIIVIAVFFSALNSVWWFVGLVVCAAIWAFVIRMPRVPWPIVVLVGVLAWVCMLEFGVHPTLSGVVLGLLTPAQLIHGETKPRAQRYLNGVQPWSALVALPVFAFFATGVRIETLSLQLFGSPIVIALIVALVIGKPLGILITAWVSTHVGRLAMPRGVRVRDIIPTAFACGIGFTVSFLIASLAFHNPELSAESRIGVLTASLIAAVLSGILLSVQSKRIQAEHE